MQADTQGIYTSMHVHAHKHTHKHKHTHAYTYNKDIHGTDTHSVGCQTDIML